MDLWIRSQDRKRLVKVDYVYIEPTYGLEICCGSYHCLNQNIGTYTTNERALEVLDEIEGKITQNECLKSMISKLSNVKGEEEKIAKLFKEMIYEMPKE